MLSRHRRSIPVVVHEQQVLGKDDLLRIKQRRLIQRLQAGYRYLTESTAADAGAFIYLVVARLPGKTKIEIRMEKNHHRPHFHAVSPESCDVSVDIATIEILAGKCSGAVWKEIQSWAFLNRSDLERLWRELNPKQKSIFTLPA
jgi:hypothetical protein